MIKQEVIKCVLGGEKPPYVPWSFKFTKNPKEAFMQYYDTDDPVMMDLIVEAEAFGVHLVFSKNEVPCITDASVHDLTEIGALKIPAYETHHTDTETFYKVLSEYNKISF